MQVVSRKTLVAFWDLHPSARNALSAWFASVRKADWKSPQDIKDQIGSADFVGDNRVIFNTGGNKFRLVAHVSYMYKSVLIKFVGTHSDYDKIDPETV